MFRRSLPLLNRPGPFKRPSNTSGAPKARRKALSASQTLMLFIAADGFSDLVLWAAGKSEYTHVGMWKARKAEKAKKELEASQSLEKLHDDSGGHDTLEGHSASNMEDSLEEGSTR